MISNNDSLNLLIERLKESVFFGSLNDNSLLYLGSRARQTRYAVGEAIFWEGERSQGLYWLHSGTLKAVKFAASGKEQTLHLIEAGQTFNEAGAFADLPNPASVVALTAALVWHIPGEAIRQLIAQDSSFAQAVIDVLSERLRDSVNLIEDLSLRPVISRLARLILDEAEGDMLLRPSWYTQNELAARLGTVADVVQRSLRNLENDRLIEVSRDQIRILNRPDLETLAA
jgi:CRP/FNR family transcriptional regulator